MTQNTPPMDWYPDPADATRERYWDGTQWTQNTRPVVSRTAAPASNDPWSAQGGTVGGQQARGEVRDPWGAQPGSGPHDASQQGSTGYVPQQNPYAGQPQATQPYGGQQAWAPVMPQTPDGVPLSGWWRRAIAWMIDGFLCSIASTVIGWHWYAQLADGFQRLFAFAMANARAGRTTQYTQDLLTQYGITDQLLNPIGMVCAAVALAYVLVCWIAFGATLGQGLTGIRVVPVGQGRAPRRLPVGRAVARAVVWVLVMSLPFYWSPAGMLLPLTLLAALMPLFTARRQSLHDLAARTQVVRSR